MSTPAILEIVNLTGWYKCLMGPDSICRGCSNARRRAKVCHILHNLLPCCLSGAGKYRINCQLSGKCQASPLCPMFASRALLCMVRDSILGKQGLRTRHRMRHQSLVGRLLRHST